MLIEMAKLREFACRLIAWLEEPQVSAPPAPEPSFLEQLTQSAAVGEKRATTRKPVQIRADLVERVGGLATTVAIENLSEHGLYFVSRFPLVRGSVVEVRVEYPADINRIGRYVNLMVRVVRIDQREDAHFGIAAQILRCQTLQDSSAREAIGVQPPE
jgi:hypothetical protein